MHAFRWLKGPVQLVTPPHAPVPFSPVLEDLYIPSGTQIAEAVRRTLKAGSH
jgi:pyruvate dehydrogenase E1 component beta subunit